MCNKLKLMSALVAGDVIAFNTRKVCQSGIIELAHVPLLFQRGDWGLIPAHGRDHLPRFGASASVFGFWDDTLAAGQKRSRLFLTTVRCSARRT